MTKRSAEREGFLGDIITTAVEGGTNYWAAVSQYQWIDELGMGDTEAGTVMVSVGERVGDRAHAVLHEIDDDTGDYKDEGLEVTIDVVARGINLIASGKCKYADAEHYVKRIAEANRENEAGDIDAGDADNIVQAGLFGEVVYG